MSDDRHRTLRAAEQAFEVAGCSKDAANRARDAVPFLKMYGGDPRQREIQALLVKAISALSVAQSKLASLIEDEIDQTATAWCGHKFKRNASGPTCACGPAPF